MSKFGKKSSLLNCFDVPVLLSFQKPKNFKKQSCRIRNYFFNPYLMGYSKKIYTSTKIRIQIDLSKSYAIRNKMYILYIKI